MRNQDPRGRRGQPLQDREPLPGTEDEESRRGLPPAGTSPGANVVSVAEEGSQNPRRNHKT